MADRYEINHEGNVVIGKRALCTNPSNMLKDLFSQYGWTCNELKNDGSYHLLRIEKPSMNPITINVFCGNIRDEDRNPYEKKIQLNGKDPRKYPKDNTIIIGIYVYENNDSITEAVFVGYPIDEKINYDTNPSIRGTFVNKILLEAKSKGFVYDKEHNSVGFRSEFAFYYLDNFLNIHYNNDDAPEMRDGSLEARETVDFESRYNTKLEHNLIVFGAPGTGKSHEINDKLSKLLEVDKDIYWERVTFHPDYSYAQFVGTYKPVMVKKQKNDENVDYIVSYLNDKEKTDQQKYEFLVENFKNMDKMGAIAVLAGVYTDGDIRPKKKDGSYTDTHTYQAEINYGRYLKNYVDLKGNNEDRGDISYEYVPGPFVRVIAEALKNKSTNNPKPHILIIEEINRANVAAVFGDVFQLLDRDDDNFSEYPIKATEDMKKYLAEYLNCSIEKCSTIRIPDNMFIWATMNSADQGVFPMDTAFKRRWDFEYLGIDNGEEKIKDYTFEIDGKRYNWNCLRKAINEVLLKYNVNEDKLLGPFFLSKKILDKDNKDVVNAICSKVLMYLFEDAAKQKKDKVFSGTPPYKYSEISSTFKKNGIEVFSEEIRDNYEKYKANTDVKPEEQVKDTEDLVSKEDS